ncbi:MAG: A24 family peptidase [Candidatus Woesearchaeota archaeon]|nr:A24 family peptidase [Candidatus Woesearchaeota archaeon]
MDLFLIVLFLAIVIASYRDIQIREVPDTLSYGLIMFGLIGSGILALQGNTSVFIESILGCLAGTIIGMGMFYARQWGGGDAKLLMGVGAILGLSWNNLDLPLFFILLIFLGAIYGLLWTVGLAFIHKKQFLPECKKRLRTKKYLHIRKTLLATLFLLFIAIFFVPYELKLLLGATMALLYLLTYSWIIIKTVEDTIMVKRYPISKLVEGDWIVQEVKVKNKLIIKAKNTGVTTKQIAQLKKAKIQSVKVKEGVPFVPGFFFAFLALLLLKHLYGEHVFLLLLGLT